jgi:hypothetical protein
MSLSTAHLRGILKTPPLSAGQLAATRERWRRQLTGRGRMILLEPGECFEPKCDLETLIRRRQLELRGSVGPGNRYDRMPMRPPIPFCWGPAGEIILFGLMLAPVISVILTLHFIGVIE